MIPKAIQVGKTYLAKKGGTVYFVQKIDCNRQGRLQVWYITLTRLRHFAPPITLSRFAHRIQGEADGWDFAIRVLLSQGERA